jgi:hypothetical protein
MEDRPVRPRGRQNPTRLGRLLVISTCSSAAHLPPASVLRRALAAVEQPCQLARLLTWPAQPIVEGGR